MDAAEHRSLHQANVAIGGEPLKVSTWVFGDRGPWKRGILQWAGVVGTCRGLDILLATFLRGGQGAQLLAFRASVSPFKGAAA